MGWLKDYFRNLLPPPLRIKYIKQLNISLGHKEEFALSLLGLKLLYHKNLQ